MDSDIPDPYKTLGVPKDAELAAIKSAYRKLALKCHPDKIADPDQKAVKQKEFYGIQQAYEILGDDFKRREYDAQSKLQRMRDEVFSGSPHPKSSPRSSSKGFYEPSYQNVNIRTAEPPKSFKASPTSAGFKSSPASRPYPFPQYASSWEQELPNRSKPIYDEDRKARRAQSYEKPSRRDEEAREAREAREAKEAKDERRRRREEEERRREDIERREKRRAKEAKEAERERERAHQERKAAEKREKQELREAEEKDFRKQQKRRDQENKDRDRDRAMRKAQDEKMRTKKEPYIETESEEDPRSLKKKLSSSAKKHVSPTRREKSSRSLRAEPEIMDKTETNLKIAAEYLLQTRRRGSKGEHTGYSPEASFSSQFPNPSDRWQSESKQFTARVEEEPEIIEVAGPPMRHPPRLTKSYTMPASGMAHMTASANSSAPRGPSLNRSSTGLDSYQTSSRGAPAVPPAPERHPHRSERRRRSVAEDDHHLGRHSTTYRHPVYHEDAGPRAGARYVDTDEVYGGAVRSSFKKVMVAERPDLVSTQSWSPEHVTYSTVPHDVHYSQHQPIYTR